MHVLYISKPNTITLYSWARSYIALHEFIKYFMYVYFQSDCNPFLFETSTQDFRNRKTCHHETTNSNLWLTVIALPMLRSYLRPIYSLSSMLLWLAVISMCFVLHICRKITFSIVCECIISAHTSSIIVIFYDVIFYY